MSFDTPLLFVLVWTVAVLGAGGMVTEIGPWYRALSRPSWQPPDWLFGPAWTTIFVLSSAAFVVSWRAAPVGTAHALMIAAFVANGALNFGWSWLFFARRRPDLSLVETWGLLLSIVAMLVSVAWLSPGAAWMILPYLGWVSFAMVLNHAIVRLNGPFA